MSSVKILLLLFCTFTFIKSDGYTDFLIEIYGLTNVDLYGIDSFIDQCVEIPEKYKDKNSIEIPKWGDRWRTEFLDGKNNLEFYGGKLYFSPTEYLYNLETHCVTEVTGPMVVFGEYESIFEYKEKSTLFHYSSDSEEKILNVSTHNVGLILSDELFFDKFIEENIKPGMSDLEKLEIIASAAKDIKIDVSGNTMSNNTIPEAILCGWMRGREIHLIIERLCQKVGLKYHTRYGAKDGGFGITSKHLNTAVEIGGEIYVVEAGYLSNPPRRWLVTKSEAGYTYTHTDKEAFLDLYDGFDVNVVVPSKIKDYTVTSIGVGCFGYAAEASGILYESIKLPDTLEEIGPDAFKGLESLKEINIPKNVKEIGGDAFAGCKNLKKIDVDPQNEYFEIKGGALVSKESGAIIAQIM